MMSSPTPHPPSIRQYWIIGNWKANGSIAHNAQWLAQINAAQGALIPSVTLGICVPLPYLMSCRASLPEAVWLGAQDVSDYDNGAFTGEVSAQMLVDSGANMVIVGHSERRMLLNESPERVARKTERAINAGLKAIVCVGETEQERHAGLAKERVRAQLMSVVDRVGTNHMLGWAKKAGEASPQSSALLFAYEPIWAIGTGKTATPELADEMHAFIREQLRLCDGRAEHTPILYGGSMKGENASALLRSANIHGGLIGGASLQAASFLEIYHAATQASAH